MKTEENAWENPQKQAFHAAAPPAALWRRLSVCHARLVCEHSQFVASRKTLSL
jgi:hypothetical protein